MAQWGFGASVIANLRSFLSNPSVPVFQAARENLHKNPLMATQALIRFVG